MVQTIEQQSNYILVIHSGRSKDDGMFVLENYKPAIVRSSPLLDRVLDHGNQRLSGLVQLKACGQAVKVSQWTAHVSTFNGPPAPLSRTWSFESIRIVAASRSVGCGSGQRFELAAVTLQSTLQSLKCP